MDDTATENAPVKDTSNETPALSRTPVIRAAAGGVLMGLANLVPGISGGTMLLACGIYERLIRAVSDLAALRFKLSGLLLIGIVVISAVAAIVLTAGSVRDLVLDYSWIMFSLFIGLTLGGVPMLWARTKKLSPGFLAGAAAGFIVMGIVALIQMQGAGESSAADVTWMFLLFGGFLGGAAMILPGVSGGYMLLILGLYIPILNGIDSTKLALKAREFGELFSLMGGFLLPVVLGAVLGIGIVSWLLRFFIERYEKVVLGVLVGLLLGSVLGLWPFREPTEPKPGDIIKGQVVTVENAAEIEKKDWRQAFFTPGFGQIAGGIGIVAAGFAATWLLGRFSPEKGTQATPSS